MKNIALAALALCIVTAIVIARAFVRHPGVQRPTHRFATIAPEGAAAVQGDTIVRFSWHAVPGALRYTVDVARPDGVPVASAATLGDTTIDVSALALQRGVQYQWTVTATRPRGILTRTQPVTFTVGRH